MERRFLELMREAGIRRPAVNQRWDRWEIDALWLPERIAIELDGRAPHTLAAQFQRDRDKDADLQLAGFIALRFTWADLTRRPAKVMAACAAAFATRSVTRLG
jgi:very-short-patch-repair endonuclease